MTGIDQPTLDNSSTNPVTRRLINARTDLINSGLYLGDEAKSFHDKGVWKRVDRENRFVTKDSAAAVDQAQQARARSPSHNSALPELDDVDFEPIIFSAIVVVDRDDCWLTPDGNWKSTNLSKFEDLKLTFHGKQPPTTYLDGLLSQDFIRTIDGAAALMQDVAVNDVPNKNLVVKLQGNTEGLKFRHLVFEKLSTDDESDTESDTEDNWTMSNWPIKSSDAIDAQKDMLLTHRPIPLPAYNVTGNLIQPDQCQKELVGSLARVTFTLRHWFIDNRKKGGDRNNIFVADVQSIRILVESPQQSMSPRKRKTAQRDPGVGSPSRKIQTIRY